jgi:hypothetical protein
MPPRRLTDPVQQVRRQVDRKQGIPTTGDLERSIEQARRFDTPPRSSSGYAASDHTHTAPTVLGANVMVAATAVPTFTVVTAGAGVGASSASSAGDDDAGFIQLVPAGVPAAGIFLTVTFATARADTNYNVFFTARSNAARSLTTEIGQTTTLTTGFSIDSRTALTAASTYQWGYWIVGYTP